jgi:hypothetical protein
MYLCTSSTYSAYRDYLQFDLGSPIRFRRVGLDDFGIVFLFGIMVRALSPLLDCPVPATVVAKRHFKSYRAKSAQVVSHLVHHLQHYVLYMSSRLT